MLLLDTNVLSELMKPVSNPVVLSNLTRKPLEELHLPAIALEEVAFGIERLAVGAKRRRLAHIAGRLIDEYFAGRIVPVDRDIAWEAGRLRGERKTAGFNDSVADILIAATARVRGLTLATRNTKDFEGLGIRLFDPWRG